MASIPVAWRAVGLVRVTFALWFAKSEVDDARDQLRAIYAQTLNGACKQASQQ